ncbi:MAG: Gfo/Idh/MocA family oxidoreductase [Rhodospirillales bacterium]|jgi:predicted dehydrogenase|nr:Gfo/Idh/MocA family oxidoreductase [Rhodospirillales bacterium]
MSAAKGDAVEPVRWGVLGAAKIATEHVIPATQAMPSARVVAIASRDPAKARSVADAHGIANAYGAYEDVLADPNVEAVYIPVPNFLHAEWTERAAEAGKHVLCEKPLTMDAIEAERMIAVRDRTGVRIEEAFMFRLHPQWVRVRELIAADRVGKVRAVQGIFNYGNTDPDDIRNKPGIGGGGVYDVGCYPLTAARLIFGAVPIRVTASIEIDPVFETDRLASALIEFAGGLASIVCATQTARYQHVRIVGNDGLIDVEHPFTPPPTKSCRIAIGGRTQIAGIPDEVETFAPVNQYGLQAEAFSQAVRSGAASAFPLEDALLNMRALDAVFRSAQSGRWEDV